MRNYLKITALVLVVAFGIPASPSLANVSCDKSLTITNESIDSAPENTCFTENARYFSPDGYGINIPQPGGTNSLSVLRVLGASPVEEITLHRDLQGHLITRQGRAFHGSVNARTELITLHAVQLAPALTGQAATAVLGCGNPADYALISSSWTGTYSWWYRSSGAPSSAAQARIQAGIQAMSSGINRCGVAILNNSSTSYKGGSSYPLLNDSKGGCSAGGDITHSEVGWGQLPTLTLATTCIIGLGISLDADTMFNTGYSWYFGASTTGCSGSLYDLQGVATHEAGHAFGLGHVAQSSNQVMKPFSATCETSQRQLGVGDATGMHALY